jgi:hypothetical protein
MSWHEPWAAEIKLAPKSVRKRHSLVFITGRTNRSPFFWGLLIDKYGSLRAFGAMALRKFYSIFHRMILSSSDIAKSDHDARV